MGAGKGKDAGWNGIGVGIDGSGAYSFWLGKKRAAVGGSGTKRQLQGEWRGYVYDLDGRGIEERSSALRGSGVRESGDGGLQFSVIMDNAA